MAPLRLEDFDNTIPPQLGRVLWGWTLCRDCEGGKTCVDQTCSGQRIPKLQRYFQFYKAAVAGYLEEAPGTSRALNSHQDVFKAIATLKSQPEMTKSAFYENGFSPPPDGARALDQADLLQATTLVVRVFVMVESSPLQHSSNRLEAGGFKVPWRDHVPFSQYLDNLFPKTTHRIFSFADGESFADTKVELRATKLRKHLGVTFRATYDIRNHLVYDYRENTVDIYHHTAFLKEQLRSTKELLDGFSPPTTKAIIAVGPLPRQLILETLDSIQVVLFPLSEPKSKALLKSVAASCSFDPDISSFEFSSIRNPGEEKTNYVYLAERLAALYHEMQNPRPRGWLEQQMQRRSGARHMMMATLIGVGFAVVLGFLSLVLSSYQAWVAYQAWKHPVASPPG